MSAFKKNAKSIPPTQYRRLLNHNKSNTNGRCKLSTKKEYNARLKEKYGSGKVLIKTNSRKKNSMVNRPPIRLPEKHMKMLLGFPYSGNERPNGSSVGNNPLLKSRTGITHPAVMHTLSMRLSNANRSILASSSKDFSNFDKDNLKLRRMVKKERNKRYQREINIPIHFNKMKMTHSRDIKTLNNVYTTKNLNNKIDHKLNTDTYFTTDRFGERLKTDPILFHMINKKIPAKSKIQSRNWMTDKTVYYLGFDQILKRLKNKHRRSGFTGNTPLLYILKTLKSSPTGVRLTQNHKRLLQNYVDVLLENNDYSILNDVNVMGKTAMNIAIKLPNNLTIKKKLEDLDKKYHENLYKKFLKNKRRKQ